MAYPTQKSRPIDESTPQFVQTYLHTCMEVIVRRYESFFRHSCNHTIKEAVRDGVLSQTLLDASLVWTLVWGLLNLMVSDRELSGELHDICHRATKLSAPVLRECFGWDMRLMFDYSQSEAACYLVLGHHAKNEANLCHRWANKLSPSGRKEAASPQLSELNDATKMSDKYDSTDDETPNTPFARPCIFDTDESVQAILNPDKESRPAKHNESGDWKRIKHRKSSDIILCSTWGWVPDPDDVKVKWKEKCALRKEEMRRVGSTRNTELEANL
ncbi:hypothetical protein GGR57DRAFT_467316 [Xylariaceae sp. FL1272]|nr:hypothetical protein GGR57DRAFT_467316 [Xylariaceae sp. FL1272]